MQKGVYVRTGSIPSSSAMDRVWNRIKETAQACAESGLQISENRAKSIVRSIVLEDPIFSAPDEALAFLAKELIRKIAEARHPRISR